MLAVVLREFGPPANLVAEERADPVAAPGQVVVEVELAGVTFVETQLRAGRPPHPSMSPELPVVLGNGVGGIVAAVGDGVDEALLGRRVVTSTGGRSGYAQRVAVDRELLIEVPARLALADAVALLADGRTALALFDAAAITPGETVLVEAAAGGVGSLLVQLAAGAGARVVAAVGGERKAKLARSLGAQTAVDYSRAGWSRQAGPVDVVFDGVGGEIAHEAYGLVREGGRFSSFGMASGAFAGVPGDNGVTLLRGSALAPAEQRALSERSLAAASAGKIRPVVGQWYALAHAADAHEAIEARETIGKTLLVA